MRADTSDVAFRLLLTLSELWDGLQRNGVDPTNRGLHLSIDYLGGYTRITAGAGSRARLIVEWNESVRHLRVVRCEEWPGFDAMISSTVAFVRQEAAKRGLADVVDAAFLKACTEPVSPARRTVVPKPQPVVPREPIARRA